MSKRIRSTDEPIEAEPVEDFLPAPGELRHSRAPMRMSYDRETDTLTLTFRAGAVDRSTEVLPGVVADFDASGGLMGLELLEASKRGADPEHLEFAVS